ncbi:unnamed protein product [Gongylonema pulchrum]|uniref:DUF5641 domain-containing protein n=1 Tax=Gongylonema pulchrum TaxID=637853 RepID=A0A183F1I0_9BILA|nr:unnamed protein product [Gongylonema pulchrum]
MQRGEELLDYWKATLKVLNSFWETWRRDYLTSLRERTQVEHRNPRGAVNYSPRLNEVVLIDEKEIPRGVWKMGRIVNEEDTTKEKREMVTGECEGEAKKTAESTAINNDGPISSRTRSHDVAAIKQQISKLESNNRLDGTLAGVFQAVVR